MTGATLQPSPWRVFTITASAVFLVSLDATVLYVAFPAINASFPEAGAESLSWVLNAYSIVFGAALVPAGRYADRKGRRFAFVTGTTLFALASVLCAVSPNVVMLIAARAMQAIGAALLAPASLALILDVFAREKRAVAISTWGAVGALASAVGPGVGATLVHLFGWRSVFLINLPVALVAVLRARRELRETVAEDASHQSDIPGAVLLSCAIAMTALGLVQVERWGPTSVGVGGGGPAGGGGRGAMGVGFLLLFVFWVWTRRHPAPMLDLSLFAEPNFRRSNLAALVFSAAFSGMFLGFVAFLTKQWNYETWRMGLAITPGPLTVIPVAILGGRYAARHGHARLVTVGGLLYAAAALWFVAVAASEPSFVALWLPGALMTGVAVGLAFPSLSGAAVHAMSASRFGVGNAVNQATRQFGNVFGVAVAVVVLGADAPPERIRVLYALVAMAGLFVAATGLRLDTRPAKS